MEAEYHGTACEKYEVLLEDLVNGELGGADASSLANHMKDCVGCRSAFKDAAASARLLRLGEPAPDPGPGFARMVMARIRTAEASAEPKSIWQPFISVAWKFAATAAMGLAVLITFDARGHQTQNTSEDAIVTRAADARDLVSADPSVQPRNADEVLMLMAEPNHGQQ